MREMKDSGVPWLGAVPAEISVSRFGRHYGVVLGKMLCPEQKTSRHVLKPYYCAANVHFSGLDAGSGLKEMWFTPEELKALTVREGDLLVAEGGAGGCAMVRAGDPKAAVQNSVMIVRSAGSDVRFAGYLLECLINAGYIDYVCNRVTISHFTKEKLQAVPFPYFPPRRQSAIADFLDRRSARITSAAAKLRRQIAVLQECRRSTICEAITKGLEPNAETKDSGSAWLGRIPARWSLCSVGRLTRIVCQPASPEDFGDSPHVSPENIEKNSGRLSGVGTVAESGVSSQNTVFRKGQILYSRIRPNLNKAALAPFGGLCSSEIWPVEARDGCFAPFLLYSMLSDPFLAQAVAASFEQVKMPRISREDFCGIQIAVPPLSEQQSIAAFLDARCARIDSLIAKKERLISALEAYRQSLIYGAVTGKTEVPAA